MHYKRLDQYITSYSDLSRRALLALIRDYKVKVNGKVETSMAREIDPKRDVINIDGVKFVPKSERLLYYKVNKPRGYLTTLSDPKDRRTIRDAFPKLPHTLVPVGRLDRQTTGLLLMTNDGQLVHTVTHPSHEIDKVYQVTLDKPLAKLDIERLLRGVILEDGPIVYDKAEKVEPKVCIVSLTSGRNRIIRRTFDQLGYEVAKLKRLSIGSIDLGGLKEGESKPLSRTERQSLTK